MNFNKITETISYVPLETYDDLIAYYVDTVSKIKGVKSIVQMGSFTSPGLSDLDLIVIVDDHHPPKFEDVSLKKILNGKSGAEIIAHDVFIYPSSLSKYIEGLFYIDQKTLLFGDPIGGHLPAQKIEKLKLILSFEYTIHRLESLVALTYMPVVDIREILLFISTLRHTYKLLADFNIISEEECKEHVREIEELRTEAIDNDSQSFKSKLNDWILPCFRAIYGNAIKLGELLGYDNGMARNKWILNSKKLIFTFDNLVNSEMFFRKSQFFNKTFRGKVTVQAMPAAAEIHTQYYQSASAYAGDLEQLAPLDLRYNLALRHAEFLTKHNYPIAKTYIIIDKKQKNMTDYVKGAFLTIASFMILNKN